MNADGTHLTRLTRGARYGDFLPAWSPDGTQVVFQSERGHWDLWVIELDGTRSRSLNTGETANQFDPPAWSPDGSRIAFSFDNNDLYVANADGSGSTQLTRGHQLSDGEPSWSPDGTKIVFVRGSCCYEGNLFVMNADGSGQMRLPHTAHAENPEWSPNGVEIVFFSDTSGQPIRVFNLYTGRVKTLLKTFTVTSVSRDCGAVPTWSPDGSYIAWASCFSVPSPLDVMRADGTGLTPIVEADVADPAWSPTAT